MTASSEPGDPIDYWRRLFGLGAAPQSLNQPILPGWSFFSVSYQNSGQPDTEREIVAEQSYGRQIGKLMEAVLALIDERPAGSADHAAFNEVGALHDDIQRIKAAAAERRVETLRDDLAVLRRSKPEVYVQRIDELRAVLDGQD